MHVQLGKVGGQLQEGCCHSAAHRLGHGLSDIDRLATAIGIGFRFPGHCDGANARGLLSFGVYNHVVVRCELAPRLELRFSYTKWPHYSPGGEECSQLIC